MSIEDFRQDLEMRRKNAPEREFFELIFEMLRDELSQEKRDILRVYLMTYSFIDVDRVASYWAPYLANRNPIQREYAALELAGLAERSSPLARKILAEYLGQELGTNDSVEIILERFRKLWPPELDDE